MAVRSGRALSRNGFCQSTRVQGSDEETRQFVQVCAYAHTPQTKKYPGSLPSFCSSSHSHSGAAGASAGAAHAGQQVLGVAELVCSSATVGCLMPQGSTGYVAAPPALRTTGALHGVRSDLLIGNNTLPTWAGASRALARLALSHLVTYPHKLTLRSSQLASPQGSSLNRLLAWRAWLLGVSCGLRVQDALQADGASSHRLATAPGTAFARLASGSLILLASSELSPLDRTVGLTSKCPAPLKWWEGPRTKF